MSESFVKAYREIKEAVVGDSPNWTHEEVMERIHYWKDFYKTWLPEMQKAGWFE
mgnify:CR=1 FL=1|tara:strand:- start:5320 stop:5481 length:162 start_codon:yes stop_codon:yes gene_type:complete